MSTGSTVAQLLWGPPTAFCVWGLRQRTEFTPDTVNRRFCLNRLVPQRNYFSLQWMAHTWPAKVLRLSGCRVFNPKRDIYSTPCKGQGRSWGRVMSWVEGQGGCSETSSSGRGVAAALMNSQRKAVNYFSIAAIRHHSQDSCADLKAGNLRRLRYLNA